MTWMRIGLLLALTSASPAWGKPCVVVGVADQSEISLSNNSTSVPADTMSQLAECSHARVVTGDVCLITETACEHRREKMDLMGDQEVSAFNVVGIVKVLFNGFNVTSQGLTRSHQDSATLPGFPYSKVLAPTDGRLTIPLGPAGGSVTNFTLTREGQMVTRLASATGTILLDATSLAQEALYTWTVMAGGQNYTGQFYIMSDEKSQAARNAVQNAVSSEASPVAQRLLRAIALQKRGLTFDATLNLAITTP